MMIPTRQDRTLVGLRDTEGTPLSRTVPVWNSLTLRFEFRNLEAGDLPDLSEIYQPHDEDLSAIAAVTGVGVARRTGLNTWDVVSPLPASDGGTGLTAVNQGDLLYSSSNNVIGALPKSTAPGNVLLNTGFNNAPQWGQVPLDIAVTGTLPDASLTGNVALLNRNPQTFTGANTFSTTLTGAAANFSGNVRVGSSTIGPFTFNVHAGPDQNLGIDNFGGVPRIGTFNDIVSETVPLRIDASALAINAPVTINSSLTTGSSAISGGPISGTTITGTGVMYTTNPAGFQFFKDAGLSKGGAIANRVPGSGVTDNTIISTYDGIAWAARLTLDSTTGAATFSGANATFTGDVQLGASRPSSILRFGPSVFGTYAYNDGVTGSLRIVGAYNATAGIKLCNHFDENYGLWVDFGGTNDPAGWTTYIQGAISQTSGGFVTTGPITAAGIKATSLLLGDTTASRLSRLSFGGNETTLINNRIALFENGSTGNFFFGIGLHPGVGAEGVGIWGGTESALPTAVNPTIFVSRNGSGLGTLAQSVGINTIAPQYTLDVNGTGRFTGNLTGTNLTLAGVGAGNINLSGGAAENKTINNPWDAGSITISSGSTAGYISSIVVAAGSAGAPGIQFNVNSAEAGRFAPTTGNLLVGTPIDNVNGEKVQIGNAGYAGLRITSTAGTVGTQIVMNKAGSNAFNTVDFSAAGVRSYYLSHLNDNTFGIHTNAGLGITLNSLGNVAISGPLNVTGSFTGTTGNFSGSVTAATPGVTDTFFTAQRGSNASHAAFISSPQGTLSSFNTQWVAGLLDNWSRYSIATYNGSVQTERFYIETDGAVIFPGNVAIAGSGSFGGGTGVLSIANASLIPSSNPSGGGVIYADAGALKYRGSSGTITILAAA